MGWQVCLHLHLHCVTDGESYCVRLWFCSSGFLTTTLHVAFARYRFWFSPNNDNLFKEIKGIGCTLNCFEHVTHV